MYTQKENEIIERISEWAESIGIKLDKDPEQI